ncbi:hypothetical protein TRVA0_058S00606 [Trichomonascus vanleenenianus]|uniref:GFA family protein n=1 Tax=Trichomonascus vanleenenianus TaxID=2268995 RepID=UPI003ECAF54D
MGKISGTCLCEQVTVSVETNPELVAVCYCSDCRKNSGYLGQVLAKYPIGDVHIEDPHNLVKKYTVTKTGSGKPKDKVFCGGCGCTIMTIPMVLEGRTVFLRSTILDDYEKFVPKKELFSQNKSDYFKCVIDVEGN